MEREVSFSATGGLRIVFKDLDYNVPSNSKKGERAFLLKKVSGWFEPHQMAALMGPSGSGKTTLLDLLAGRKTQGVTTGTLLFGGKEASSNFLKRYTGYVEQFDTLLGILTVEEMLMYTAELKRSNSEGIESKRHAVDKLLSKLALDTCRHVKIGSKLKKGISGGQAKRANIGIALIANPRVLFLDEPTSGLDSYTANEVMQVVKALDKDGTTICATIHSPSQFTFGLFDRLLMLVRGQVVYFGPTEDATEYAMAVSGSVKQRPEGYNDAEFIVDLITEADILGKGSDLAEQYESSALCEENAVTMARYLNWEEGLNADIAKELDTKSSTMIPWYKAIWVLIKYRTTRNYRDGEYLGVRIADKIMISLIMMTLFFGIGNNFEDSNLINISAFLFIWNTFTGFSAFAYVPAIFLERGLYARERADGLYSSITYLLAKMVDEILLLAILCIGVSAYTFYGVNFQGEFVLFFLLYWVSNCVGVVLAYVVACIAPSMEAANGLLPTYVISLMFLQGFFIRFDDMPPWWSWYQHIDFFKYSWCSYMVNQFSGDQGDPVWAQNGGMTVLGYYSLKNVDKWAYLGYLSLFFLVYFLMAWAILTFKNFRSR